MSIDTSKDIPLESRVPEVSGIHKVSGPSASLPQKFATLPRQWAPGDERTEPWERSAAPGNFSKTANVKKNTRKKEKVSLFERVTGKKDGKKPEWYSQDISDWTPEGDTNYETTNPFWVGNRAQEQRVSSSEMTAQIELASEGVEMFTPLYGPPNPFEGPGPYTHLTRMEVEQELVKHKELLKKKDGHIRELEDYIDNLLVRVMEETPSILRVPYVPSRKAGKFPQS